MPLPLETDPYLGVELFTGEEVVEEVDTKGLLLLVLPVPYGVTVVPFPLLIPKEGEEDDDEEEEDTTPGESLLRFELP